MDRTVCPQRQFGIDDRSRDFLISTNPFITVDRPRKIASLRKHPVNASANFRRKFTRHYPPESLSQVSSVDRGIFVKSRLLTRYIFYPPIYQPESESCNLKLNLRVCRTIHLRVTDLPISNCENQPTIHWILSTNGVSLKRGKYFYDVQFYCN